MMLFLPFDVAPDLLHQAFYCVSCIPPGCGLNERADRGCRWRSTPGYRLATLRVAKSLVKERVESGQAEFHIFPIRSVYSQNGKRFQPQFA